MTTARGRSAALALTLPALLALACADVEETREPAADSAMDTTTAATDTTASGLAVVRVEDAGLQTPESVLHDEQADVYIVSNINGAPLERDDNGFISRVRPDGTVEELRWIDGAAESVPLSAPKGLAIHGDTLFVTDIDSVRAFNRTTGAYLGARGVPGATFLNDLTVGPDGTLYVSDSGMNADFSPSGTDAVYRFEGGEPVAVAEGTQLGGPNGLVAFDGQVAVVGFGGTQVRALRTGGSGGEPLVIAELPGGQLDGVVRLPDGSFLVSSWETQTIYRIPGRGQEGRATPVVEGVPSPADIGWDARRQRVLIPVFQENRLEFRPIRTERGPAATAPAQGG